MFGVDQCLWCPTDHAHTCLTACVHEQRVNLIWYACSAHHLQAIGNQEPASIELQMVPNNSAAAPANIYSTISACSQSQHALRLSLSLVHFLLMGSWLLSLSAVRQQLISPILLWSEQMMLPPLGSLPTATLATSVARDTYCKHHLTGLSSQQDCPLSVLRLPLQQAGQQTPSFISLLRLENSSCPGIPLAAAHQALLEWSQHSP